MPPSEILHRLAEIRLKAAWRMRRPGLDETIGIGPIGWSPLLRARLAEASRVPAVSASAERTMTGRLRFLGRDWPNVEWEHGAGERFWLYDPVTGGRWPGPEAHAFTVGLRNTGHAPSGQVLGDVKYVWEPARLQCLQPLSAAAAADAPGAAATVLAILRDFARTNPPYGGVHWASGIEAALRLASLTCVCASLGPDWLGRDDIILVRRLVVGHARLLVNFPSLHSSANNHRFAEGLGLFLAGRLAPDLGTNWEREGGAILEDLAPKLILADGGGAEQSVVYHAFTLEMGAFAALLAADDGRPFSAAFIETLTRGAAFLLSLLDTEGRAPSIGDDDETRVIAQPPDREPRYVASVVAAIAGLTRRFDLLPPARDEHLRDALFAAPQGARPPSAGARTFPQTGYTVVHDTLAGSSIDLVFDHGPLGYLSLAAHGHADALSVWLSVAGQPVLIDPGTWLYHSGGAERLRLRESPNHNTLVLGGVSQSEASSAFSWSSKARASCMAFLKGPDWQVVGVHDGYRRRFGMEHRRRIARLGEAIAIGDALPSASTPIPVEIRFLLPGHLNVAHDAGHVSIAKGDNGLCRLSAPSGFTVAIHRGVAEGAARSLAFGEIEDAQRIIFAGLLGEREAFTLILPPAKAHFNEDASSSHDGRFEPGGAGSGKSALARPLKDDAESGA